MLVLSGVFGSLAFVVWLFSTTFWLFLLGFFLAVSSTFASGPLQAYVYDFLKANTREDEFERVWGAAAVRSSLSALPWRCRWAASSAPVRMNW